MALLQQAACSSALLAPSSVEQLRKAKTDERKEGDLGLHGLPSAKVSLHLPSGETVAHVCKAVRAEGFAVEISHHPGTKHDTRCLRRKERQAAETPAPDDMKTPSRRARCPLQYFCLKCQSVCLYI